MTLLSRPTLKAMARRKTLAEAKNTDDGSGSGGLLRSLTGIDLVLYGVGSSVGAGIYVMIGLGSVIAGPAISVSFLACGAACILTSLAYAEFAARIPVSGSAYTYVYVAFGECLAWCVAWFLILGYGFTASVVARAWADYCGDLLIKICQSTSWDTLWLERFTEWEVFEGYSFSLLSMVIIGLSTLVLLRGVQDSAIFNNAMTIMNVLVLVLVIVAGFGSGSIDMDNLTPFVPNHAASVLQGAGLVFFAFIGFDMVASLSEEVVNPERNMPIGIVGSLLATTCIYVSVSLAVVGMAPIKLLGETVPVINSLLVNAYCTHSEQVLLDDATTACLGNGDKHLIKPVLATVSRIVQYGAVFGLTVACFTSLMGQPRIFYRMAQDGLWFPQFADVDPVSQVPRFGIIVTGVVTALLACFVPLDALANLISLGTLMVFTFVDAGVILLRVRTHADKVEQHHHQQQQSAGRKDKESIHAARRERRRRHQKETNWVALLLVAYTFAVTCSSVIMTKTSYSFLAGFCMLVAIGAGLVITTVPETWVGDDSQSTLSAMHEHHFLCPFVPGLPLAGIACNAFMMGSLPTSSWFFCSIWLVLGVSFYFIYGIHHSKLQHNERYAESAPLVAMATVPHTEIDEIGLPNYMDLE
ncbi:affinity cationic amino acid transporter 1 [Seminavis robusta]|uniref:Affinity cationic amino acid transporter 1 n=1 Tax=Seminavis robusta TaxID=568900 RepID=A0A9N8HR65_9STRA|nr:affinity cationic amino acid transporter 1 [Seminavis robusta]|eukprot:Sro1232_g254720.1 affinity cationic amino acid transporter 1 (641) ;mRNA; f:22860-24948